MTLPANTTIYFSQVNSELGRPAARALYMSEMRGLAGVGSGPIYMSQLWGKSSYTPMSFSANNVYDEQSRPAGSSSYTGNWNPSVNVSGGTGGYTYNWVMADNPGSFTLSNTGGQYCTVSKVVARFGGSGSCTLICYITDNTGHQVSLYVTMYFNYYSDQ